MHTINYYLHLLTHYFTDYTSTRILILIGALFIGLAINSFITAMRYYFR